MLWSALGIEPAGVFACVGAGGKTSLIQSLAAQAAYKERFVLVTSTTKMFYDQVAGYRLLLAASCDENAGTSQSLQPGKITAWFAGQEGIKVLGVSPHDIDRVAAKAAECCILVEADGARRCLIKAPAAHEPVIPDSTIMTIGVLNLNSLGRSLTEDNNAHRLELVTKIVGKSIGADIEWQDLAKLAIHRQGIFQYAKGTKILLLSGAEQVGWEIVARQIAGYIKLAGAGIERVIITTGFGSSMQVNEVHIL